MKHSELVRQLRRLKHITPRQAWVSSARVLVMREIRRQDGQEFKPSPHSRLAQETFSAWAGDRLWGKLKTLVYQPVVGLGVALALVLASGLTVNAAFYSLPGGPLYRVKLAFERTQLALVSDSSRKAELKVEFVRNRVEEIEKMVAGNQAVGPTQHQVTKVVSRFTEQVASVRQDIQHTAVNQRTVFQIALSLDQASHALAAKLKPAASAQTTATQREMSQAVRAALAAAEATSYSALQSAILAQPTATSSQPLPAGEISQYLEGIISRLHSQVLALSTPDTAQKAFQRQLLEDLDSAHTQVTLAEFAAAFATVSSVRLKLENQQPPAPAAIPLPSPVSTPIAKPQSQAAASLGHDQTATSSSVTAGSQATVPSGLGREDAGGADAATRETTQDFIP